MYQSLIFAEKVQLQSLNLQVIDLSQKVLAVKKTQKSERIEGK